MRIKVLVLSLVTITLMVTMSKTTLSYFMDAEESEAIFTIGNVQIQNVAASSGVCDDMKKNDACTKTYSVENTGQSPAYVRVRVLIPEGLVTTDPLSGDSPALSVTTANDEYVESANSVFCDGVSGGLCREYVAMWDDPLPAGSTTEDRSVTIEYLLDAEASVEGEGNEGVSVNPANLGIKIYTEAIQAQGFSSADDAFSNF